MRLRRPPPQFLKHAGEIRKGARPLLVAVILRAGVRSARAPLRTSLRTFQNFGESCSWGSDSPDWTVAVQTSMGHISPRRPIEVFPYDIRATGISSNKQRATGQHNGYSSAWLNLSGLIGAIRAGLGINWAWNLARQFGSQGVTVNNLAPGAILTARNRVQMATEGEALVQRIPAGRLGRPDDLAGAALLLCSDAGAYINGINLYVDGGRSIA